MNAPRFSTKIFGWARARLGPWLLCWACWFVACQAPPSSPPPETSPAEEESPDPGLPWPSVLRFGINSHLSASTKTEAFRPLLDYLSQETGVRFELVVAREYSDLSQKLISGEVDVCDLSPLNYVMAKQADPSLRLLVRQVATGSSTYSAYLITRPESGIQTLADLRGRSVAYVDTLSASGYLFPAAALMEAGLDPMTAPARVNFLGSHEAVARAVLSGEYDAGALWSGAFDEMRATLPELRGLEVIYKSERIPFDGYVARGGLPPALLDKMRRALLTLSTRTPAGRRVLGPLPSQLNGFISAQDRDYDVVRGALRALGERGPAPLR